MTHNRYIVIVGCGRLGSHLANQLSRGGDSVVVIDRDHATFGNLSADFSGFRVEGDATQMSVLREARLNRADILIATTHKDNINLMAAQVARRIFGVSHVLARVFDPRREAVYTRLGIDTICPTSLAAGMFLAAVSGESKEEGGARP
ncbi:TrkA family potassium uptake protein [Desulfococcus sp.]|uniref:potassium channel family protein n=1 Tax=Desulfococcus sp. TaxID=2025834 RepID=UPI00359349EA